MPSSNGTLICGVISHEEALASRLAALASEHERQGGIACQIQRLQRLGPSESREPNLIVLDLDAQSGDWLEQLPQFRQRGGRSWVAVTSRQPSPERLLKAMRSGANDYVSFTPTLAEFGEVLGRASNGHAASVHKAPGQLISVFSSKGGVGTTTVAVHLAASLAAHRRRTAAVALVDLVFQHGDVSAFLEIPRAYSVTTLASELDRLDANYLQSALPKHRCGVWVVPAPERADEGDEITPVQVGRMLHRLCSFFDAVVVDVGHELTDATLTALNASQRLVLVVEPSLPSVRNTHRTLELLGRLNYEPSKIVLVVNRHNAQGALDRSAMEEALRRKVHGCLPNAYQTAVRALNRGSPVQMLQPHGPLATQIDRLVTAHLCLRPDAACAAAHASGKPLQASLGWLMRWARGAA